MSTPTVTTTEYALMWCDTSVYLKTMFASPDALVTYVDTMIRPAFNQFNAPMPEYVIKKRETVVVVGDWSDDDVPPATPAVTPAVTETPEEAP